MAIIQDWKIRSTDAKCELTDQAFADGEDFYTCIFDDPETDGFIRRDYSVESWGKVRGELDPQPFSFWRSTYKAPLKEEDKKAIEDTSAEGLLRRFIQEDDARTENARYILALMLERKKTLVPTDSQETDTRRLLFYEHAQNADVFIVADPELKLDEIEVVQREVSDLLAAEEAGESSSEPAENQSEEEGESSVDEDSVDDESLEENSETDENQPEEDSDETAQAENESIHSTGE